MASQVIKKLSLKHISGVTSYQEGLKLQQKYYQKVYDNKGQNKDDVGYLIVLQHSPVYTIGKRKHTYTEDYMSNLQKLTGAEVVKTNRGGLITYHNPGQMVAYPIVNLRHLSGNPGARDLVCRIEKSVMQTCAHDQFDNLETSLTEDTGIWVNNNKICALGLKINERITTHGLALNCNNDMFGFTQVVPCGLVGKGVTSLSTELKRDVSIDEVLPIFFWH